MDVEYQRTLKEANELFNLAKNDKIANKLPPCQEEKAKVLIFILYYSGQQTILLYVINY